MINKTLKNEIEKLVKKLSIKKSSTLYIAGNIYNFGIKKKEVYEFCENFLDFTQKKIGKKGNIVVPTATLNFVNSNKIYNPMKTKSYMMGIFSEHVRNKKNSFRSSHPLWSFSGFGGSIKKILGKTSYSAYGDGSVFENLLNFNTYFISLGEPHTSIGMIHYVENLIGVPYRYNKEIWVHVRKGKKILKKYCLLGVRFKSKNMISDNNVKIINKLKLMNTFKKIKFGKGNIYICKYQTIVENLREIIMKNPRIWLKNNNVAQVKYFNH